MTSNLNTEVLKAIAEERRLPVSPEIDAELEFECPKCGGSYFGSGGWETDIITYYCHDQWERGCHWKGTKQEAFHFTYDKSVLAQELLECYKRIQELEEGR